MNSFAASITLICCTFFLSFSGHSQVEKHTWNGKEYYVYPHQNEDLTSNMMLYTLLATKREVLKRDEENRKVVSVTIEDLNNERELKMVEKDKNFKKLFPIIKEGMQTDPDFFMPHIPSMEAEITPATEPLPDGSYIQFYRDMPYLDGKTIRFHNDKVAAVFDIQNGLIQGEAVWYDGSGKIVKKGSYDKGSRTGMWTVISRFPEFRDGSPKDFEKYKSFSEIKKNIIYTEAFDFQEYRTSLKHGVSLKVLGRDTLIQGEYKDNKMTGTWITRGFRQDPHSEVITRDEVILIEKYTIADEPQIGKSIILRDNIIPPSVLYERYENYDYEDSEQFRDTSFLLPDDAYIQSFSEFYSIAYPEEEESYDLPDEENYSFEGEEGNYEWEDENYYSRESSHQQLIDSLGYRFRYTGVYEKYYSNGQLCMRFEIVNGTLVEEDTVYWDNGLPANVVVFVPDSNRYEVRYYDYAGKLGEVEHYDVNGESLDEPYDDYESWSPYELEATIEGREFRYAETNDAFLYKNPDAFEGTETEKYIIEQKLWKKDSSVSYLQTYDPAGRTLETTVTAISKKPAFTEKVMFSEDFRSLNAQRSYYIGDICYRVTASGSYDGFGYEYWGEEPQDPDSISNKEDLVRSWEYAYSDESEGELLVGGKPFTGEVKINLRQKKYSLKKDDNSIEFSIPDNEFKQVWRARYRYWKRGKWAPILDAIQPKVFTSYTMPAVLDLFPELSESYNAVSSDYNDYEPYFYEEEVSPAVLKAISNRPHAEMITGTYVNGRAHGKFITHDQYGREMIVEEYSGGDENGVREIWSTTPDIKLRYAYSEREYSEELPEKPVRYVSRRQYFKNGYLNGASTEMDWKGDTLSFQGYVNSEKEGFGYVRNPYIYSYGTFERDMQDGISRTYLTLPGRDSILLYDLNFQNGALQGESRSYHTNGKLAKRGFFLYGQPIDDFEAYDTLGNIYQYVKFQFSQPVQEKIWEENQLSVLYEFDWRDSIDFYVADITESPSVEELLARLGYGGDYYEPYYGRPSLVDKEGISYSMTKYYPNDTIARIGAISSGKKVGCWMFYNYEGKKLYEVEYADTILKLSDSITFRSKGVLTYLDSKGEPESHSYIIEKFEKYDCSHTDHYEERMLYNYWEKDSSVYRQNGYVKNYYDNGVLMNEGNVKNGLPEGVWKLYDNGGNLSHVGEYLSGKRNGRWMSGDLADVRFLGDICLNPNLPNLEEIISYQEKLLDITVSYYHLGEVLKKEYFGINKNSGEAPDGYEGDEGFYEEGY